MLMQPPVKNGNVVDAAIFPEEPTLQEQPVGTLLPVELDGQATTVQPVAMLHVTVA